MLLSYMQYSVAPLVGVWIETSGVHYLPALRQRSRPSWACGLKQFQIVAAHLHTAVAPLVGVWIETYYNYRPGRGQSVAPLVGVWIETLASSTGSPPFASRPSWACGLKHMSRF